MTPATPSEKALFFDLDGTLTDPKPGITGCIRFALIELGHPAPEADALEWCIGPPLIENFTRLVGEREAPRAVELYRERFGDVGLYENDVYPGIPGVLEDARARGARLFVASSKPLVYVERILDHFDLTRHFEAVFGSELDGTRNDKRELLAYALDRIDGPDSRLPTSRTVMIGDRAHDAIGAHHNRMPFLGALYGYGTESELEAAGATTWVHHPHDLTNALFGPPQ